MVHRKLPDAIKSKDAWDYSYNGNKAKKWTTKGWSICFELSNGETMWKPLKDVKEACPVELAEYAYTHSLQDEPAFCMMGPIYA